MKRPRCPTGDTVQTTTKYNAGEISGLLNASWFRVRLRHATVW